MLKTDKTSPYLNDLNEILPQLEKLLVCIENNDNVQKFKAKAYFFNKTVDYLRNKYEGKPESSYISYQKLLELSSHTQSIATYVQSRKNTDLILHTPEPDTFITTM